MTGTDFQQFEANPAQYRFLQGMKPGGLGLFCSGVGIGKSTLMREVACILATYNPYVRGLLVSHVLAHTRIEHVEALIKRLGEFHNYSHHVKQDRMIYCVNGAQIQYGSADRPDTLDGYNVGWALGDEIRYWREEAHATVLARVRDKDAAFPFIGFFTTPDMNWIYDAYSDHQGAGFFFVRGATRENIHNLRPGYYDDLKNRLSPQAFKQYVEGHWGLIEGAVFRDFDLDFHVQDLELAPNIPVDMGIDFGIRAPAVLFFQHVRWCQAHGSKDCIHILDELVEDERPTRQLAIDIKEMYARNYGWTQGEAFVDPAGVARSQEEGFSSVSILQEHGIPCSWTTTKASRYIPNGLAVIRGKLKNVKGESSLFFQRSDRRRHDHRGIVEALSKTEYRPRKQGQALSEIPREDQYKHILDALRYAMINKFPPAGDSIRVV